MTGFAAVTMWASATGVPPVGALVLGGLGAWTCDWPDIDHHGSVITKSLRWIPYRTQIKRDKDGSILYHRPVPLPKRKPRKRWARYRWYGAHTLRALGWSRRRPQRQTWWFPSQQVHGGMCALSAAIYDRCATPADRRDCAGMQGPAFRIHRGFAHSLWCALITGALWCALLLVVGTWHPGLWSSMHPMFGVQEFPVLFGETVVLGMCTHVCGDGCTDYGISPFAPLIKVGDRRYPRLGLLPELLRFKVSQRVEKTLIAPLCVLWALMAVPAAFLGPERVLGALGRTATSIWSIWRSLA
jgi:membrane-bound metal-dependent hydrolase YbcI (DUF457 family)